MTAGELVRRGWLFALIIGLIAFFTLTQPAFASVANGFAILRGISIVTIIACAVTISLVVAGFDLSVGANAGLAMMLSAISLVIFRLDAPSAIAIALIGGFLVGSLNVLLIVRFGIPDLLATLATLFVVQGFQLVITGGRSVATGFRLPDATAATGVFTPEFLAIGRGTLGPIPAPVLLTVAVVVALQVFLTATRYGRQLEAVGANPEVAHLAGIGVGRSRATAYLVSGVLAALGGVVLAVAGRPGRRERGRRLPARRGGGGADRPRGVRHQPAERGRHRPWRRVRGDPAQRADDGQPAVLRAGPRQGPRAGGRARRHVRAPAASSLTASPPCRPVREHPRRPVRAVTHLHPGRGQAVADPVRGREVAVRPRGVAGLDQPADELVDHVLSPPRPRRRRPAAR